MLKRNWLFSLLACLSCWGVAIPVKGQALLPYAVEPDSEKLEQQGLKLIQDAAQLVAFGQYDMAFPRARLATQLAPNQFQSWFILGTLYLQKEEYPQAIENLEKARSLAPDREGILFTLGSTYFRKGDYRAAIRELEAGLKLKPDSPNAPSALFDLGNAYLKVEQYSRAIAAYQKAHKIDNKYWAAVNNIGLVKYEQGDVDEAIETWQNALKIEPNQPEPQLAIAVALYRKGQRDNRSFKLAETALKTDNRYANLEFLEENLWGRRLLRDTRAFLATPQMKVILARIEQGSSKVEVDPL
ncbi:MAG: tetratricopeptide repeat protein [Prochloraceae cyanobacterium]|nr:tetratricopeptide repeat protein [Prochloraceae cyanobacterium]